MYIFRNNLSLAITLSLITNMTQLLSEQEVLDSELPSVCLKQDIRQPVFQSCSQPDHILWPLKEVSMLHSEICIRTTGDGISMIQSREVTGLVTKMPFNIWPEKLLRPFLSWNHTACHFQEQKKAKSTREHSVVNRKILAKVVKPTDAVQLPIELDIVCSTHFSEEPLAMIAFSSLNILPLISLWTTESAKV